VSVFTSAGGCAVNRSAALDALPMHAAHDAHHLGVPVLDEQVHAGVRQHRCIA
jgi:hypothetical protein